MHAQPERSGNKVLLIDGDELIRDAMRSFLEAKAYELTACRTVTEGIEALGRGEFDLILCDQSMPSTECFAFMALLDKSQPSAKRVLMTSPKSPPHPSELTELGVDAVIEKPLSVKSVEDCLAQVAEASCGAVTG